MLLKLDNAGSVFGDVSYLNPDAALYSPAQYSRMTIHGDGGMIEVSYNAKTIELTTATDATPRLIPIADGHPTGCLDAFLDEIAGDLKDGQLTTADVIDASCRAIKIQHAADRGETHAKL